MESFSNCWNGIANGWPEWKEMERMPSAHRNQVELLDRSCHAWCSSDKKLTISAYTRKEYNGGCFRTGRWKLTVGVGSSPSSIASQRSEIRHCIQDWRATRLRSRSCFTVCHVYDINFLITWLVQNTRLQFG